MRTIKFRAWDKKQKKMFNNVSTGTISIWDDNNEAKSIDCEFMQFTGLLDKNGVEIYEGDFLEYQNPEAEGGIYAVPELEYNNYDDLLGMFDSEWEDDGSYSNIEVIGNLHQNPELLK